MITTIIGAIIAVAGIAVLACCALSGWIKNIDEKNEY
jgi:hypothetical protein